MVRDSVEITGHIAADESAGIPIRYYDVDKAAEKTVHSCQGDLFVICNVLADYAQLLREYLESDWNQLDTCGQYMYEYQINRCLKIQHRIEEQIGYSHAEAVEKCLKKVNRRNEDVGDDALILLARRQAEKKP